MIAGLALATGVLGGSPSWWLGAIPAVAAAAVARLGLAAGGRPALVRRIPRLGVVADGVDEALRLLRTARPGDPVRRRGLHALRRRDARRLLHAFGNAVPPVGVLLVAYIIGQLGGLIPIPGGIGGVDGGLIGTLVVYGVDATDAAVAVIAYRGLLLAIPGAARPARAGRAAAPAAAPRRTTSRCAPRASRSKCSGAGASSARCPSSVLRLRFVGTYRAPGRA